VSFDLELDDAQQAIGSSVAQFCRDRAPEARDAAVAFDRKHWRGLAELGVLSLATPDGAGGAREVVAAMEALGAAVFAGPLAATFCAAQLLAEPERQAVVDGEALVSLGAPPLLPFAPVADLFIEFDASSPSRAWRARPRGAVESVETLAGDPWGRVELDREEELAGAASALALSEIARAAYLAGAGQRLLDDAAEHARTRTQFGRTIGEFQAVAHPLADCSIRLSAAVALARIAAAAFDAKEAGHGSYAAAARLSAAGAALEAVYVCHQAFGAVGITLEGPAFRVARRVRQLVSEPPIEPPAREAVLELFGV
jgi:alkylation response protein AidB-like acyl-CoA dehydrogenase